MDNNDIYFSLKTAFCGNDWDPDVYYQKHKNLFTLLDALEISFLFRCLFQHGNDYHLTRDAKEFVLCIDKIFTTPIGKALRRNNLPKILEYKDDLFKILERFDLAIRPYPENYSIWFHNTKYYYYKFEKEISSFTKEINDTSFTDYFFGNQNEYYYLSNTQLYSLFKDMKKNKKAFENEGKKFIQELGEIAYKRLNSNSLRSIELYQSLEDLEKISDIIQWPKELNSKEKRIFNKYIKQGKIERVPFASESGFINMYGIDSYNELKKEVLRNSSYQYIK